MAVRPLFAFVRVKAFTLIETLVAVAVFAVMAVGAYQAYTATIGAMRSSRLKIVASTLANEQFEIIRNLPYADVGIIGGVPNGKIPATQNLVRDGISFTAAATIRNIDDPFDGTIGGAPNDLSPADYKLAEINISCPSCDNFSPLRFDTHIGPRNLEAASTNGSLFARAFDAAGQPVPGANVHVENDLAVPPIVIDDVTDANGMLQIVDAPPAAQAYEITVSKSGYSTEQTYPVGAPGNPNPTKPHATVALQQLTQISFAIDRTGTIDVTSTTNACSAVPAIDFFLSGAKLIGTAPDVLKYSATHVTDGSGRKIIGNLEWDTYNLALTDGSYDLTGTILPLPFVLNPNSSQSVQLIVAAKNPNSVMITVKDTATQLPLSGASVQLAGAGYDTTLTTGRGFLGQTDWSGGAGQEDFTDSTRFFSTDGNLEVLNPAGEIKLWKPGTEYVPQGNLVSSTFDTGSASNFYQILWLPLAQPPDTGPDSVKFQIATNNDKATWNFLGPDGTAATYYTAADQNINPLHNGNRYFRYKTFLSTADTAWTPSVSDVSFTFTSSCVPPGQVLFDGLAAGDYTLTVSKTGYQTVVDTVSIATPWQQREVLLAP